MTHTPVAQGRKASRAGLLVPYLIAAFLVLAWSSAWVWMQAELGRRIDTAAGKVRAAGGQVAWASRRVSGYPFRLDVDFTDLRIADASGWMVGAPVLKSEALAFLPGHWVFAATEGATVAWPGGGPVTVRAQALRASVSGLERSAPRIAVEGQGLAFVPAPGARPFFLTAAEGFQFDTRAGPNDQGEAYLALDHGQARPESLVGRLADGGPVDLTADLVFSHASQLRGAGWSDAVRRWSHAGGGFSVRQVTAEAGQMAMDARAGTLTIGDDGRLAGAMPVALRQAGRPGAPPAAPQAMLDFTDGAVGLDGVRIMPAPRLF